MGEDPDIAPAADDDSRLERHPESLGGLLHAGRGRGLAGQVVLEILAVRLLCGERGQVSHAVRRHELEHLGRAAEAVFDAVHAGQHGAAHALGSGRMRGHRPAR